MLFAALALVPIWWVATLWILAWLEERTLAPDERAQRIAGLLEKSGPDEIERTVAEMLANRVRPRERPA